MLRAAVILPLCFIYSLAYTIPASMSAIPEEFKEFIPEKVREFYKQLTPEDKEALRQVVAGHADYANVEDALNALKEKNEKLYQKALEIHQMIKTKVDSLSPQAKAFVESIFEKMKELRPSAGEKPNLEQVKTAVREVVDKYKALPESAQQDLKSQFPTVTRLIQNEKFRKLAKGFLNKQS